MKNVVLFCFMLGCLSFYGQDTLFFENFNNWNYVEIDSVFTNYDEDQTADFNGLSQSWFVGNFGNGGQDSNEVVALSSSWLVGYAHGNRNHLRLPGITLGANAKLSWKSAPALGNLYMDGYSVLISTDPEFYYYVDGSVCDTLLHFSQNTNDNPNSFSAGIKHNHFDSAAPISPTGVVQYPGKLTPYEVDLSAYAGQLIYINFLHNSDDDNFLALDDILITSLAAQGMVEKKSDFTVYPNPCRQMLHLSISDLGYTPTHLSIFNVLGELIYSEKVSFAQVDLNIAHLKSGYYFITLSNNSHKVTQQFNKL